MLSKHFIVEEKVMNGSIEIITEIVYDDPRGPNFKGSSPLYVIVDFPHCTINRRLIPNKPLTHI